MPTIDIREVDISTVSTADVTTNTVYVPGFALTGPVETPILCSTLDEFQSIFGPVPYKFQNSGSSVTFPANGSSTTYTVPYSWSIGQPDPSYVYASDLLRLGLPVIYHRVNSDSRKSKIDLSSVAGLAVAESVYSGLSSADIKVSLEKVTQSISRTNYYGYVITVSRGANADTGMPAVSSVKTYFTFSDEFYKSNPKYIKMPLSPNVAESGDPVYDYKYTMDNSGLVQIASGSADFTVAVTTPTNLVYQATDGLNHIDCVPAGLYTMLYYENNIASLKDKNEYVFKFITSGGYPSFFYGTTDTTVISDNILNVATVRKDITALIDYSVNADSITNAPTLIRNHIDTWIGAKSLVDGEDQGNYATTFIPWCTFNSPTLSGQQITLPPSFAYLSALANSTQTYANWYAVAGVTRGFIPNLVGTSYNISEAVGNALQPTNDVSINPIQLIRPYGYRIWGSRTLRDNSKYGQGEDTLMATSFLNVRQLANDIKRTVYVAIKDCMFEPDDDVLWINFKSKITPLLDQMKGNRGLTEYTMRRVKADKKATLKAVITAYVIDPVEHFDITLELSDDQVSVTE